MKYRLRTVYPLIIISLFGACILSNFYYDMFYSSDTEIAGYNNLLDLLSDSLFVSILVSIKYLVFLLIFSFILKKATNKKSLQTVAIFGVILTLLLDFLIIFVASVPESDAGFAIVWAIILTPIILVFSTVLGIIIALVQNQKF